MAEMTRYVFATPAKGIATGTKACGRCRVRYLLAIIATAFLLAPSQGCVTETRRESALDSTGRGVSVELRRAITGIGYKGVLFTPLDTQGSVLLGWTPSAYDIARMESHLPQILPDAGPRLFASGLPDLAEYRRQYSGHLMDDRRILQVNLIHSALIEERNLDWEHNRSPIHDVGARYFQVWFDLDAERIVQLLPAR